MKDLIKEIEVKSIITKSKLPASDYCVNPYIGCLHACKYCYASFMKRFTVHDENWGDFVDVKVWKEIKNIDQYTGKSIFLGSVTDPYQPLEEKYERTKAFLEEIKNIDIELVISTKSDLILRDLPLLKMFRNLKVAWSINTLDENFKNDMDRAVSIERRIEAMKKFHEQGICTVCFISPIFPKITDVVSIIEKCKDYCDFVWLENLNLRGDYKFRILNYIKKKFPQIYDTYDDIYHKKNMSYWQNLDSEISEYCKKNNFSYLKNNSSSKSHNGSPVVINYFYHEEIRKK